MNHTLDEKIKNKIIAVISALIPDAQIYLFGSRARGTNGKFADIDIALNAGKPLPIEDIDELESMLKESNILYTIEIVDFYQVTPSMQEEIIKDRIIWKQ